MVHIIVKDTTGKDHIFELKQEGDLVQVTWKEAGTDKILGTTQFGADDPKSILDIGEDMGIEFPYSCRAGACTTCLCEVAKGKESLDQKKAGEPIIDLMENEFLSCIGGIDAAAIKDDQVHEIDMTFKNQ